MSDLLRLARDHGDTCPEQRTALAAVAIGYTLRDIAGVLRTISEQLAAILTAEPGPYTCPGCGDADGCTWIHIGELAVCTGCVEQVRADLALSQATP